MYQYFGVLLTRGTRRFIGKGMGTNLAESTAFQYSHVSHLYATFRDLLNTARFLYPDVREERFVTC
jgi:hypothetical protein